MLPLPIHPLLFHFNHFLYHLLFTCVDSEESYDLIIILDALLVDKQRCFSETETTLTIIHDELYFFAPFLDECRAFSISMIRSINFSNSKTMVSFGNEIEYHPPLILCQFQSIYYF